MKKILLITAIMVLAAGSAFAADLTAGSVTNFDSSTTGDGALTITPASGTAITVLKPSNNVNGAVIAGAARFSATDKHLSGSRNFAAASTETKIFWALTSDTNKGTATLELSLAASDTSDFADWTAL